MAPPGEDPRASQQARWEVRLETQSRQWDLDVGLSFDVAKLSLQIVPSHLRFLSASASGPVYALNIQGFWPSDGKMPGWLFNSSKNHERVVRSCQVLSRTSVWGLHRGWGPHPIQVGNPCSVRDSPEGHDREHAVSAKWTMSGDTREKTSATDPHSLHHRLARRLAGRSPPTRCGIWHLGGGEPRFTLSGEVVVLLGDLISASLFSRRSCSDSYHLGAGEGAAETVRQACPAGDRAGARPGLLAPGPGAVHVLCPSCVLLCEGDTLARGGEGATVS